MQQLTEKRTALTPRSLRLQREARPVPAFVPRAKPFLSARAVGSYVPGLTRSAFEKHGFAAATLITDWARIAGPELAAYTAPEQLKWQHPRRASAEADRAEPRPAATLILRVDAARALDAEYRVRQIMERVNTYFGYRAVGDVKILQAAAGTMPAQRAAEVPVPALAAARMAQAPALPGVEDAGLAGALGRLKAGIEARSR